MPPGYSPHASALSSFNAVSKCEVVTFDAQVSLI